jgi:hypothetical protein
MGVEAFGIYASPNSLSVLLDILRVADPPPYLRDEVVLAMSAILDTQNRFYPVLVRFTEDPSLTATLAQDEAEAAFEFYNSNLGGRRRGRKNTEFALIAKHAKSLQAAVSSYVRDNRGAALARLILEMPSEAAGGISRIVLSEAVLDDELVSYNRLKLLIVNWVCHEFILWTRELK